MLNNKILKLAFLFIIVVELLSFLGYYLPVFNLIGFFAVFILTLIFSIKDIKYGVWIAAAELIIGSKGYLFHFDASGAIISIRVAVWLAVMSVWFARLIIELAKNRRAIKESKIKFKDINGLKFLKSAYFPYFMALFAFIAWGLVIGLSNRNGYSNVFFDFNGWLYFLLIFPVYIALNNGEKIKSAAQIFFASVSWLCLKTFFLLFAFSHNLSAITFELYKWVRITGVGEITQMQSGFSRIFFQSHIFALIGFFIFLFLLARILRGGGRNKKTIILYSLIIACLSAVNFISLSRSNWLGLIAGLLFFWFIILAVLKADKQYFLKINAYLCLLLVIGVGIIAAIIKFPYPKPTVSIDAADMLADRAGQISEEAGAASRWSLLPILWNDIKQAPLIGKGFGAAVTYKSNDPRVLEHNPNGMYTTYAFEWGWLDIWLKLGLFGVAAYLILLGKILLNAIISGKDGVSSAIRFGLSAGLIAASAVNFFSPYMNHPLGIGYLILTCAILENINGESDKIAGVK